MSREDINSADKKMKFRDRIRAKKEYVWRVAYLMSDKETEIKEETTETI